MNGASGLRVGLRGMDREHLWVWLAAGVKPQEKQLRVGGGGGAEGTNQQGP